jgi:hypothetical protein
MPRGERVGPDLIDVVPADWLAAHNFPCALDGFGIANHVALGPAEHRGWTCNHKLVRAMRLGEQAALGNLRNHFWDDFTDDDLAPVKNVWGWTQDKRSATPMPIDAKDKIPEIDPLERLQVWRQWRTVQQYGHDILSLDQSHPILARDFHGFRRMDAPEQYEEVTRTDRLSYRQPPFFSRCNANDIVEY